MATLLAERQASFARGMNDSAAPLDFETGEVSFLENYRPTRNGGAVQPRGGSKIMNATALGTGSQYVDIVATYYTTGGTQQLIAFCGTHAYKSTDYGATWTDITGALTIASADYDVASMSTTGGSNYLFFARGGSSTILQWDGTTLSELTASAGTIPAGVRFLAVQSGRLYAATQGGLLVYATAPDDPTNWDTTAGAFAVAVNPNETGARFMGMRPFGSSVLVWTRRSTNYIEGYGTTTIQVESGPRGLSRSVGLAAPRSLVNAGSNALMWLSERGFEYFDGQTITLVSRPMQGYVDDIDPDQTSGADSFALWYPKENEYWCWNTMSDASQTTYVWRAPVGGRPAAGYRFQTQAAACAFTADTASGRSVPHYGNKAGQVVRCETGTLDQVSAAGSGGTAFTMTAKGRPLVYGNPAQRKRARTVRALVGSDADGSLTLGVEADGASADSQSVAITASDHTVVEKARIRTNGRGRVLVPTASTTDPIWLYDLELDAERMAIV